MFPPVPATLEGLTAILQDPRYRIITATHDANDNLYAGSVTAADNSYHVIFMSRRMARVARSLDVLFGDGTFKVLPAIEELDEASQVEHYLHVRIVPFNFYADYLPLYCLSRFMRSLATGATQLYLWAGS